ncbi:Hypothetical predicted protein [Mytilus galloprovincialis]|uniref:Endonuclease/exonuclease/phosphatase domain-containing protein n=1 Tax=Mytilus galloprovincialis TaxID=29158 RepID=A0A8B6CSU9_MYTGA|nr:Hypothetical predicted protein [Mytilus galloprovincialis]
MKKANNPGLKEVVCITILDGFSLIAFQELADKKALEKICEELNSPSLACTKNWPGHRGEWQYVVSDATGRMYRGMEYNGFLYDTTRRITLNHSALLEKPSNSPKPFTRAPFIGTFKIKKFDCIIVSVRLKATGLENEDIERLQNEIDKVPDVIDAIEKQYPDFDIMREKGYSNCVPVVEFTNISNSNPEGSQIYDHIWINSRTNKAFSGNSGVIRKNLTSPLIPNGWSWGDVVSDHCLVWTELYTGKDYDSVDLRIIPETSFTLTG